MPSWSVSGAWALVGLAASTWLGIHATAGQRPAHHWYNFALYGVMVLAASYAVLGRRLGVVASPERKQANALIREASEYSYRRILHHSHIGPWFAVDFAASREPRPIGPGELVPDADGAKGAVASHGSRRMQVLAQKFFEIEAKFRDEELKEDMKGADAYRKQGGPDRMRDLAREMQVVRQQMHARIQKEGRA